MPDFWEFPTVVDGPRPDQRDLPGAVQQVPARPRHQGHRPSSASGRSSATARWTRSRAAARCSSPPSRSSTTSPSSINCNLQRLDGPVRGNGKIIQELEAFFRGAGWNVIKVDLGPRVGPAAGRRPRRRPGQPDEHHAGRRLPDLPGRGRRLHPGELLRPRPAHPQDGREHVRRRHLEAAPRRARLPQGLRGLQGRHRAHRPADRHPRQDHQGLGARPALRRPQRDPPDEEVQPGRPQDAPRPAADPDHRRRSSRPTRTCRRTTTPGDGRRGHPVPARASGAGSAARCRSAGSRASTAQAARRLGLRGRPARVRQAAGRHDDGVRPAAQGPHAGQGVRPARRADHPGRGPHLRDGLVLPDGQDLQPARADLHLGRPRADARLQGVRDRPDPPRRDQRGGLGGGVHRGGHVVRDARRADGADLHLLLDVRLPADRRRASGRRPTR